MSVAARYAIPHHSRCSACGALGHRADADGLCSRSSLAMAAVRRGARARDAATEHGLSVRSIHNQLWVANRGPGMRARRRVYIEARITAARRADAWFDGRVQHRTSATWDGPLEVASLPTVDTAGADHAEIPDPPHLLEVGWRTTR